MFVVFVADGVHKAGQEEMIPRHTRDLVMSRVGYICENPRCWNHATEVHHFYKVSVCPERQNDPRFMIAYCSGCHAEVERRLREEEDARELYPLRIRRIVYAADV